jgi:hypothetical protein
MKFRSPCWQAVGERREARQIPRHAERVGYVLGRQAREVGAAHDRVRAYGDRRGLVDDGRVLEQAMAEQQRPGAVGRGGRRRDDAHEARLLHVARGADREAPPVEPEARPRRAARLVEEARHRHTPGHAAGAGDVADLVDAEGGRRSVHPQVAQVAVAEPRERPVAHEEQALREVPPARDREVPREVEIAAADPRLPEALEDVLHVRRPRASSPALAETAKRAPWPQRLTATILEVAQRHDVAAALAPTHPRTDVEGALSGILGQGVQLGPDQLAPQGLRVDHDDRLPAAQRATHVGDRCSAASAQVEPGHERDDDLPGAEAVGAVVVPRLDRPAVLAARHHRVRQREPAALAEVVVGPRQ